MATATVYNDPGQLPFVLLSFDDVTAATIRIDQTAEGRTRPVRGAIGIAPETAVANFEVPFNTPVTYIAALFDTDGAAIGFSAPVTVTVVSDATWVHQPLDPTRAVQVEIDEGTAEQIERPTPGELRWAADASLPRRIGGRRRGIVDMPLIMETETEEQAAALDSTLGDVDLSMPAVLCIRTPGPEPRIPRLLFASVDVLTEQGVNVSRGGRLIRWPIKITEALPAAPALAVSILGYDDLDYNYPSYDLMDAAYASYRDRDTDFSLAGTAP